MIILCSFGSGFKLENTDPDYIAGIAEQVALANSYNIEVGGYVSFHGNLTNEGDTCFTGMT